MMRVKFATYWCLVACGGVFLSGCGGATDERTSGSDHAAAPGKVVRQQTDRSADAAKTPSQTTLAANAGVAEGRALELLERLVSPNPDSETWDRTHAELLEQGAAAVRVLAGKLRSGTEAERELSATTLALFGPDAGEALAELRLALTDQSLFVRANAAATLVQLPGQADLAVPTLLDLLQVEDVQLRQLAAVNLNASGSAVAGHIPKLQRVLLTERLPEVAGPLEELLTRLQAATVLSAGGSPEGAGEVAGSTDAEVQLTSGAAVVP